MNTVFKFTPQEIVELAVGRLGVGGTARALAAVSGKRVDRSVVSRWRRGHVTPSLPWLKRLCTLVGVSMDTVVWE